MTTLETFLANKLRVPLPHGIDIVPQLSDKLWDWQREVTGWGLRRGRAALFEDCGLGKTRQQVEWARCVAEHTGKPTLILAPLAVAGQTVREGALIGVPVTYVRSQAEVPRGPCVVVANYEMLKHFTPEAFGGVVWDESSILKAYQGATKQRIIAFAQGIHYRLACTATPAPNDHLELLNHGEALGILKSHEALARWFLPDTGAAGSYRLKGHAVEAFWDWVSSWARCIGKPSDLGAQYSDAGYELPPLVQTVHALDVDITTGRRPGELFRMGSLSATDLHREKRLTLDARAQRVAELVTSEPGEPWLVWCDTDYEDAAFRKVLPGATSVRGSDKLESKERALMGFADGSIRTLITKPKIAGFGLNWQHCARVIFGGSSFSYEAWYQAIRRTWRFGQKREVRAHVVMGATETGVWSVVQRKAAEHESMKREMYAAMRRARERIDESAAAYRPTHRGRLPEWLTERRSA